MRVAGESENYGPEQERLNNVFGAHLRITALRAASGPGIELLEYLVAPGWPGLSAGGEGERPHPLANQVLGNERGGSSAQFPELPVDVRVTWSGQAPGREITHRTRSGRTCRPDRRAITKPKRKGEIEMQIRCLKSVLALGALLITGTVFAASKMDVHTSSMFQGPKANTGTVSHSI